MIIKWLRSARATIETVPQASGLQAVWLASVISCAPATAVERAISADSTSLQASKSNVFPPNLTAGLGASLKTIVAAVGVPGRHGANFDEQGNLITSHRYICGLPWA